MSTVLTISRNDIIQHTKLSGQIPAVMKTIAKQQIIIRTAKEVGIEVTLEELQRTADQIRLANKLHRSEETWSWLQQQGLSIDEFESMIEVTLLTEKLAQHLFSNKVQPFFVEHQLDYTKAILYEVMLEDVDLAMELFYAMQAKELNFHSIAHQYGTDLELRRMGGYRGLLSRSELKPEISAAVFRATPPEVLVPMTTSKGVHLIFVEAIVQPQLDAQLRLEITSRLFTQWLDRQVEQIQVNLSLDAQSNV